MLDNISDEYIPIVESLERECDEIDAAIIHKAASEQPDMLQYSRPGLCPGTQARGSGLTHVPRALPLLRGAAGCAGASGRRGGARRTCTGA